MSVSVAGLTNRVFRRLFLAVKNGAKKALDALRAWAQRNPRTFKVVVIVLSAGLAAGAVYGLLAAIGFTSVGIAAGTVTYIQICVAPDLILTSVFV